MTKSIISQKEKHLSNIWRKIVNPYTAEEQVSLEQFLKIMLCYKDISYVKSRFQRMQINYLPTRGTHTKSDSLGNDSL